MSPSSPRASDRAAAPSLQPQVSPPGPLKRSFIRYGSRFFASLILRVRCEGFEHIPADAPYLVNFNHPSWVDPFLLVAWWPRRHQMFIFGPKEMDMRVGRRNRLITWSHMAVPFKPSKSDLIDTTRRATAVLKAGYVLIIAGEGRLSDREGEMVPLQEGAAFLALRARVPIVPVAVIGTRWVRFGKRVTLRVGAPIHVGQRAANREGMAAVSAVLTEEMNRILVGAEEEPPPGRIGRWLTDLFADRPWLREQQKDASKEPPDEEQGP